MKSRSEATFYAQTSHLSISSACIHALWHLKRTVGIHPHVQIFNEPVPVVILLGMNHVMVLCLDDKKFGSVIFWCDLKITRWGGFLQ